MIRLSLLIVSSLSLICLHLNYANAAETPHPDCVCGSESVGVVNMLKHEVSLSNVIFRAGLESLTESLEEYKEILQQCIAVKNQSKRSELAEAAAESISTTETVAPLFDTAIKESPFNLDVRNVNNAARKKRELSKNCTPPSSCTEAAAFTRKSGLYTIQLETFSNNEPFWVNCDEGSHGGGWTVIQRRLDGSIEFYRDWAEYKLGFGHLDGEFWIGLDKLHALTTHPSGGLQELLITMEDFDGAKKYAKYSAFAIGNESEAYALKILGNFSGDAGDSLTPHVACKWSTKDRDNDNTNDNCAVNFTGAWWYKKCHTSNLNGKYLKGPYSQDKFAQGVVWEKFRGYNYALKSVQMMIRPQRA